MSRQRIYLFSRYVARTYVEPLEHLITIVRARECYSPMFRAAALRHLVLRAPLHVTGGQPFAARRRAVRRFYQL
ncbi:hypothetical protein BJG93_33005 (plasmid) [Paraburkholderia sprentiae WSM5005]|uniref:Uncharacterized protein n=1 Tax=Paraburkholderia sprentiae WSM5005 TaxID=754502 RepID=A0A1I9YW13_9BURK|nr:hypothetical protein [Paraburkholderia sprentiae]APA90413.1 hypothetical protein BJG93_33005 [Paraburkholderia sprentiae WSM5005]